MIDIADFAVGQSRMLYGKTLHSERPPHRMYEQWHPLGVVGVVTAFNFPGGGLGVERDARVRLRQRRRLEAVAEDAAMRARRVASRESRRSPSWTCRRSSRWRSAATNSAQRFAADPRVALRVVHRIVAGRAGGAEHSERPLRQGAARMRRQQRRHRRRRRRPRPRRAGGGVRRRRHGRPALHDDAAADRARSTIDDVLSRGWRGVSRRCASAIRWNRRTLMGPLIDRAAVERLQPCGRRRRARPAHDGRAAASVLEGAGLFRRADARRGRRQRDARSCSARRSRRCCT